MNIRRKLLTALGAGALAAPFGSRAQQPAKPATTAPGKIWRVGFLAASNLGAGTFNGFTEGMREIGYIEGKNLKIEWRIADGDRARLPGLAAELAAMQVDAIVAEGSASISAAQKATTTIPVVMTNSGDPVVNGFVKTLARPGGNITGTTLGPLDLTPKRLEMLRSIAPKVSRIAILSHSGNVGHPVILKNIEVTAATIGVTIVPLAAASPLEIESAFSAMRKQKAGAFIVLGDPYFIQQVRQIAELAAKHALPSIGPWRQYPEAGGLLSYGASVSANVRRAAYYLDKIFKGANPAELPVEQPTRFDLVINGKTAKALGLKIPQSLLISADKVIE